MNLKQEIIKLEHKYSYKKTLDILKVKKIEFELRGYKDFFEFIKNHLFLEVLIIIFIYAMIKNPGNAFGIFFVIMYFYNMYRENYTIIIKDKNIHIKHIFGKKKTINTNKIKKLYLYKEKDELRKNKYPFLEMLGIKSFCELCIEYVGESEEIQVVCFPINARSLFLGNNIIEEKIHDLEEFLQCFITSKEIMHVPEYMYDCEPNDKEIDIVFKKLSDIDYKKEEINNNQRLTRISIDGGMFILDKTVSKYDYKGYEKILIENNLEYMILESQINDGRHVDFWITTDSYIESKKKERERLLQKNNKEKKISIILILINIGVIGISTRFKAKLGIIILLPIIIIAIDIIIWKIIFKNES